jgi:hypothetical protein
LSKVVDLECDDRSGIQRSDGLIGGFDDLERPANWQSQQRIARDALQHSQGVDNQAERTSLARRR